ncbi:hypothetical protein [Arthrobacter sedimenti]|uniref:ParB/Sulfiredoxin domain-containing protein n=1 Tax=Arthrobacter sedimenti TaxID=2694931 RepID=A0ABV8WFT4_9MICC
MSDREQATNGTPREDLSVEELLLDEENPRLANPGASQIDLLRALFFQESLEELALSFQRNGYFQEEPLVTIRATNGDTIVVEGNRRLATLKLLLDPSLLDQIEGDRRKWPVLSATERERLLLVPTIRYPDRETVAPYLGFRHITGARTWKPLQKARFVAGLVAGGRSLKEVQGLIGDPQAQAAQKMYQSYVLYEQIRIELPDFDMSPITENFSLLETFLSSASIKRFLGLPPGLPGTAISSLIAGEHLSDLEQVLIWIFGNDEEPAVIRDSREIKSKLAPVVANERALAVLTRTYDLESAYDIAVPSQDILAIKIKKVTDQLSDLIQDVAEHSDDETILTALEVLTRTLDGARAAAGMVSLSRGSSN